MKFDSQITFLSVKDLKATSSFYENNFDLNEFFGNPTPINNSKLKNNPLMYTKEKLNENNIF